MPRVLKTLHCPRDGKPLEALTIDIVRGFDVTVDRCPNCEGLFLDKGEIKRVTGHDKLNALLTKHAGLDSDSQLVCPGCGMVMDLEDADGTPVEVCLSCFGVWLDAGELEKLKASPDEAFAEFSPEKVAELQRAKAVKREDAKRWWKTFMYRLAGRDLRRRSR